MYLYGHLGCAKLTPVTKKVYIDASIFCMNLGVGNFTWTVIEYATEHVDRLVPFGVTTFSPVVSRNYVCGTWSVALPLT